MSSLHEFIVEKSVELFRRNIGSMNRREVQEFLEDNFADAIKLDYFVIALLEDFGLISRNMNIYLYNAILEDIDYYDILLDIKKEIDYDGYMELTEEEETEDRED